MDLTEAVAELYAMAPDGFLARRRELVVAARAVKDRDAVTAIGALRRPAVAAWLVNLLQRDADGGRELAELAALGVRLREAQFTLAADRLRELGRERRTRVADLVSRAVDLAEAAGHTVSPAVEREIDETLVAAVADEAAADAVLSGSLTRPLSYSGFGDVDLELAVAVLPVDAGPSAAQLRRAAEREAQVLDAALVAAESALAAAADDASRAAGRLAQARATAIAATRTVTDLERELTSAREAAAEADAGQQAAEADALTGRRAEQAATKEVQRLRRARKDLN